MSSSTVKYRPLDSDPENAQQCSNSTALPTPELPVSKPVWYILLVIAVFVYSSFTILVHLCEVDGHLPFKTSAVVLSIEVTKLILSVVLFAVSVERIAGTSIPESAYRALQTEFFNAGDHGGGRWLGPILVALPFTVPALLYGVNNNLGIRIQLEMDPATYQVLGNFKILSTAVLFRLIIKRKLSLIQWFSLFLLLCAGFTHSYGSLIAKKQLPSVGTQLKTLPIPVASDTGDSSILHITTVGVILISIYCTISGLSGVYTEYVLKKRAQMNINLQNAMLYIFGILVNGFFYLVDVQNSSEPWHLFKGFTLLTWLLVFTQAVGGIFMGFVMKFANNITRLFIISSAMLATTLLAMCIFGLHVNWFFGCSFLLVITSLILYHT